MRKDLKILILSANYGEGHTQVSRSLQKGFSNLGIQNVSIVNLFNEAHPIISSFTQYLYIKSFSMAPSLYGWSYYQTQHMRHDTKLSKWFNSFGIGRLREIIKDTQPDLVINTFPMLVMPMLREKTGIFIPTFTVLTDFVLHNRWIHNQIDKYYVATEDLKRKLVEEGISANRILTSGIPLRDQFNKSLDTSSSLQNKYGLDPMKKTVLIMAGAFGVMQNLDEICQRLLSDKSLQVLLVCGKNEALLNEMQTRFVNDSQMHIFGFIDLINELMGISSCIVTKPGGITLSESLHCNLPIVLFRPVPGQEKENARYLAEKGAAVIAQTANEIVQLIQQLLNDDQRLVAMRQSIGGLQKRDALQTIIFDILHEFQDIEKSRVQKAGINLGRKQGIYEYST